MVSPYTVAKSGSLSQSLVVTTRRDFLTTAAAAAAVGLMPGAVRAAQVPHSALSDRLRTRLGRVGLQLYTARSEMAKSVEATLEKVAAIGYRDVEFAGYFDRDPGALRAAACTTGRARAVSLLPDEERYEAESDGPGWLLVRSSHARGWRATVDGEPALVDALDGRFDDVRVVTNRYGRGASGNRNSGAEAVSTAIIAFLDDDARAHPGWLAALVAPAALVILSTLFEPAACCRAV